MPCWHDPLEVDNGLHVGIKNLMKTGVAYTACEKKGRLAPLPGLRRKFRLC